MNLPTYDKLLQPLLVALHELGGTGSLEQIQQQVLNQLQLPEAIASQLHPGRDRMTELAYRLHWARTYLKQYGLIQNPRRGLWQLSPEGEATREVDPSELVRVVKARMAARRLERRDGVAPAPLHPLSREIDGAGPDADEPLPVGSQPAGLRSLTPNLRPYAQCRHFLAILDGTPYDQYRAMYSDIWSQRGNPQEQTDWADPTAWIPERLEGDARLLALRLWQESQQTVNPRYVRGAWYLANKHGLLERDAQDILRICDRGRQLIAQPDGAVAAQIDSEEGILHILRLVAEKGPGKRGDFLAPFAEYCRTFTTFQSENVIKSALYDRLRNLADRGFVLRRGQSYEVADEGLQYLDRYALLVPGLRLDHEPQSDILKIAKEMRELARTQLYDYLLEMNPYKFEELIKLLLEEMGYDDVETTSPTNDKGVDVVANIELGISSVREVIQVKRHRGSINRTVLDQLRGSLHRFDAVRGTVITTGRFSKGVQQAAFERGAAPITLIDGDKLLDLLLDYQIGVEKKSIDYYEFDPAQLAQFEADAVD